MAVKSYRDKDTEAVYNGDFVKRFSGIASRARTKLFTVDAAQSLDDLRSIPGNRLEALKGERSGQFSIRVNDQYRICFEWTENNAHNVELTDYH